MLHSVLQPVSWKQNWNNQTGVHQLTWRFLVATHGNASGGLVYRGGVLKFNLVSTQVDAPGIGSDNKNQSAPRSQIRLRFGG